METIEKLNRLLDDGKISPDEYEELKKNLPKPKVIQPSQNTPWQVWFCAGFLLAVGVYDIYEKMFIPMIVCVVLGISMLYRSRIAYIILGIIGIVSIFYAISLGGWIAALLDLMFVVVQCSIWKYYFNLKELDHKWSN